MVVKVGAGVEPVKEVTGLTLSLLGRNTRWEQLDTEMFLAVQCTGEQTGKGKHT